MINTMDYEMNQFDSKCFMHLYLRNISLLSVIMANNVLVDSILLKFHKFVLMFHMMLP